MQDRGDILIDFQFWLGKILEENFNQISQKKLIKKKGILPELVASQPQIGHDMKSTRAFHEGHKMHPVLSNYFNRHALQNQEHKSKAKVESAVHVL